MGAYMTSFPGNRFHTLIAISVVTALYALVYFLMEGFQFPIQKDELHFWPTSLFFSNPFPPTLAQLRTYKDLNTPFPFLLFGGLEHFFQKGIWMGRLANYLISFACVLGVLLAKGRVTRSTIFSALGLLSFPYFLGVSTHLYTDIIAAAFVLLGVSGHFRERHLLSSCAFSVAVSSRQYSVVFPTAVLLYRFFSVGVDRRAVWLLIPLCCLGGWFVFWGGPAPETALSQQVVATVSWNQFLFQNIGYFLASVGVYFVIPEFLFFNHTRRLFIKRVMNSRRLLALVILVVGYFALFPPMGNPPPYAFKEMGFLDKSLRFFLPEFLRVVSLGVFALLAVIRFAELTPEAAFVFMNAVMMAKAHIAWDKYALSLLIVLWWMKAAELTPYPAGKDAVGLEL